MSSAQLCWFSVSVTTPANVRVPTVAICIPTYNQAGFLEEAVSSAFAQDYAGYLEVWVSDDRSDEQTRLVLRDLRERFPELRVILQEVNLGIAANSSAVLRAPDTEFVVRLDSDDVLEQGFVRRLTEQMLQHPDAGYAHSAVTEIDANGARLGVRHLARGTSFQQGEHALRASLSGYRTVANVLMFRKTALEEVGFLEGRPDFVEDYDLSVRLADAGWGNVYVDEPLARYRIWWDAGGVRPHRRNLQLRGLVRIFEESIEPAWARRGWSLRRVRRQRARLAASKCAKCFRPHFSLEERADLICSLLALSDSPWVKARIWMCRRGAARHLISLDRALFRTKSVIKGGLRRARRMSRVP